MLAGFREEIFTEIPPTGAPLHLNFVEGTSNRPAGVGPEREWIYPIDSRGTGRSDWSDAFMVQTTHKIGP
jgi:hypothetical protein